MVSVVIYIKITLRSYTCLKMKTRIEHISFECQGEYMDVESHIDYVDITIGGTDNAKFSVTLEEWAIINKKVLELLKQK
jgi:hypothetical protein